MANVSEIFQMPKEKKYAAYEALVKKTIQAQDVKGVEALVKHFVEKEGSDQHGRTYITPELLPFIIDCLSPGTSHIAEEDQIEFEDLVPMMENIVPLIQNKVEDFPEAVYGAKKLLSVMYAEDDHWQKAAFARSGFRFDKFPNISVSVADQVAWHVETASWWLECHEPGSASQAISKAHKIVSGLNKEDNLELLIEFRTQYARVQDRERKFLEASQAYKLLTETAVGSMGEQDLIRTLQNSVTCAILARAGPARSRVLAMLFSDERTRDLPNFIILEKMFKERIIREAEIKSFEKMLETHQMAVTSTGRTVLQNALVEHNMLAASKIYNNIKFGQLASLLGINTAQAEELASKMIEQGRMKAVIDQIEELVEFSESDASAIPHWDHRIEDLCLSVNNVLETISKKHSKFQV